MAISRLTAIVVTEDGKRVAVGESASKQRLIQALNVLEHLEFPPICVVIANERALEILSGANTPGTAAQIVRKLALVTYRYRLRPVFAFANPSDAALVRDDGDGNRLLVVTQMCESSGHVAFAVRRPYMWRWRSRRPRRQ